MPPKWFHVFMMICSLTMSAVTVIAIVVFFVTK